MNKHNYIVHIYEKQQTECCKLKKKLNFLLKLSSLILKKRRTLKMAD